MDKVWKALRLLFCLLAVACQSVEQYGSGWAPVRTGKQVPALSADEDVVVMEGTPPVGALKIGHIEPTEGQIVRVSMEDDKLLDYFKSRAAGMGANVVVLNTPRIQYKSGKMPGTVVTLYYVGEQNNTHGGDDVHDQMETVPYDNSLKLL